MCLWEDHKWKFIRGEWGGLSANQCIICGVVHTEWIEKYGAFARLRAKTYKNMAEYIAEVVL